MIGKNRAWLGTAAAITTAAAVLSSAGCAAQSAGKSPGASQYKPITVIDATGVSAAWPYYGTEVNPPLPKPDWTLTDTAGAAYDVQARTKGRITVLFFGYTSCADECPTMMADMAAALRTVPAAVADQVSVLFVTVDPAYDNGRRLSEWLGRFYPRFVGLTAPDATVIHDAGELGIPVDPPVKVDGVDSVRHGTAAEVFNQSGYANFFWGPKTSVLDIAHDLNQLTVRD
ncbi:SCO family protein [Actinospica durhamensis]|uniref:SCO family protein n=1 Tax=Actinospica durhamensis TaxID=1508375 RepID=A0A941EWB4_9ACTN|nr:SCO family protein [Actinospica durhamensis]MBR7837547.1 SCO family protein [Actinospica durhamensis]